MEVRELIRLLEKDGWVQVHQVGSHCQYKPSSKPGRVTVSGNPGIDVKPGTLKSVMKQAQLEA